MHDSPADIRNLYQELIIDHGTQPRNFCTMNHPDCAGEGYNPLCGDQIALFVRLSPVMAKPSSQHINTPLGNKMDGTITEVTFQGKGCAISMASASLLTETVLGKTIHQAIELCRAFQALLTSEHELERPTPTEIHLGKLEALAGVKAFPARVKCATLAWHTFLSALSHLPKQGHDSAVLEQKEERVHVDL